MEVIIMSDFKFALIVFAYIALLCVVSYLLIDLVLKG